MIMDNLFLILMVILLLAMLVGIGLVLKKMKQNTSSISNSDWQDLKDENTRLKVDKNHLEERIEKSITEFKKQEERENEFRNENRKLYSELEVAKADYKNLEAKLVEQAAELEKLNERFTKEFKLVANELLKENSTEFSQRHHKELDQVLSPLKEKLKAFEEKIQERYEKNRDEQLSLKHEIKQLTNLNNELNQQAQNLTHALKGDSKTQGNWGELVLSRILESSGLGFVLVD
jgi:DNA recombination protein RmuC